MGGIFSCCFGGAPAASRADVYKLDASGKASTEVKCEKKWVGQVIGPGGKVLHELRTKTGAMIDVVNSKGNVDPVTVRISGTPAQVKAGEAAVSKIIAEAENPDYEGKVGKKWRAEADRCAQMAEKVAREKDALFDVGDKSGGHQKLAEVKEWQRKMHEANAKAAEEIFLNRNAGKNYRGEMVMDFHGLRKAEAIAVLEKRLDKLLGNKKKMMAAAKKGAQFSELELIPGAGNHSGGGGAVLKPAIIKVLRDKNIYFQEKNKGSIIVQL